MAAPLNTCSTIEQRGVVRFLWAKNMEAKDIHKEMLPIWAAFPTYYDLMGPPSYMAPVVERNVVMRRIPCSGRRSRVVFKFDSGNLEESTLLISRVDRRHEKAAVSLIQD
jgi:hypothetical protein